MAVYYSFHYDHDAWRVQQVVNMGAVEGQPILNSQEWEEVNKKGKEAIEQWIADNMAYKTAVVVLVGAETASRPWVLYEIRKAWDDKKPLVGVRIHGLADTGGNTDSPGANPFDSVTLTDGSKLSAYVPLHNPAGTDSKAVYDSFKTNLKSWADSATKRA